MTVLAAIGYVLLLSATVAFLVPIRRLSPLPRGIVVALPAAIGLAKVQGLSLIAYPAGVLGDLSITTQSLLALAIAKRVADVDILPPRDRSFLLATAAATGWVLYTFSSGLTMIDLYSLGFGSGWFMIALAAAVVACSCYRARAAWVILLGVLAFDFRLLTSTNVWDYLLDPVLVLFSWGWTLSVLWERVVMPGRSHSSP